MAFDEKTSIGDWEGQNPWHERSRIWTHFGLPTKVNFIHFDIFINSFPHSDITSHWWPFSASSSQLPFPSIFGVNQPGLHFAPPPCFVIAWICMQLGSSIPPPTRLCLKLFPNLIFSFFSFGYKPYDVNIKATESMLTTLTAWGEGGHNYVRKWCQKYEK